MRTFRIVLLTMLLAEAAPSQQDSAQAFDVSSEASLYVVRGRLVGTFQAQSPVLRVVVKSASIFTLMADSRLQLRAVVAGASGTGWRKVLTSEPEALGAFGAGERRELRDSIVFTLSVPPGMDLQQHWLVFEFGRSDGSTTYACSERNLAGPDSLSARRAHQLRTVYPLAC